jgi:hypothetical protein
VRFARYVQLGVAFHLLVAFLPFAGHDRPNAFWQYNRALFIRFLWAAASSATLWLGLSLALVAVDKLFGVDVPPEGYGRLCFVIAFVFNTWFFLGGVPTDLDALDARQDYPAALRVFAQYTLLPLVSVYLVILTLYFGKVVVTWDWPSGWIGNLVSGVAGAGILTLLLVHPLVERADQRWIAVFARDFWLGVLPAVVMLWLALYQRVHQYGLTEPRYYLLGLSLWLGAIAAYYVVTRSRSIRVVPVSLCLVALVTFAGPWGAFSVSERSQLGRLRGLLGRHGMLAEGRIRPATGSIPPADQREISAIVRYLVETHGPARLVPLLGDSLARRAGIVAARGGGTGEERVRRVVEALGVPYVGRRGRPEGRATAFSYHSTEGAVPLGGYDLLIRIRVDTLAARDTGLVAILASDPPSIRVMRGGGTLLVIPIEAMLVRARRALGSRRGGTLPAAALSAGAENDRIRATLYLWRVGGQLAGDSLIVGTVVGEVLLKLKR